MDRINFEELESAHNVVNGSKSSFILDSVSMNEAWVQDGHISLQEKLCMLLGYAQSVDEIWPPRMPPAPFSDPDCTKEKKVVFLFNNKYFLVSL